jgi:hypothetical protein
MRRLARQTRQTLKLSDSLHRDLTGYALAAGAAGVSVLALASPSEGQIVYTPTLERIGRNGTMLIDLNHDGASDVTIREIPWSLDTNGLFPGNSVQAVTPRGGGIRYSTKYGIESRYASSMRRGAQIGSSSPFRAGAEVMVHATDSGVYYGGGWSEGTRNGFLGIRFRIGRETHYGWARFSMRIQGPVKGIEATLTGYAYESQPDTAIRAGDTGGANEDSNDDSGPSSEIFSSPGKQGQAQEASLGTLALGRMARALQ